jgi:hypothetical protein
MLESTLEEPHQLRRDLLPIEAAAALAYEQVYDAQHRNEHNFTNDHIKNVMAHALAMLGAIYTVDSDKTKITKLQTGDLATGVFRDGARRLFFYDGRPELTRIVIKSRDLARAIEQLIELHTAFAILPVPAELRWPA